MSVLPVVLPGAARIVRLALLAWLVLVGAGWIGGTDGHEEIQLLPVLQVAGVPEYQVQNVRDGELDTALLWTAGVMHPGRVEAGAAGSVAVAGSWLPQAENGQQQAPFGVTATICAPGTPWPCEWARAVVGCESSFQADAWATEIYEGKRYWFLGLFQIAAPQLEGYEWLYDPHLNTVEASIKYVAWQNGEVPNPWPTCG